MPMLAPISLEQIAIASPCAASWDDMKGDDRKRFCAECNLHVYNISGMTRKDAEALISGSSGRLCVRLFKREDGTVMTRDCPVGFAAARLRLRRFASGLAAMLGLTAIAAVAADHHGRPQLSEAQPFAALRRLVLGTPPPTPAIMGKVMMGGMGAPTNPPAPATTPAPASIVRKPA